MMCINSVVYSELFPHHNIPTSLNLITHYYFLSDTYAVFLFWDSDVSDVNEYGTVPLDDINRVRDAYKTVRVAFYCTQSIFWFHF